jgi:hypothetical protein
MFIMLMGASSMRGRTSGATPLNILVAEVVQLWPCWHRGQSLTTSATSDRLRFSKVQTLYGVERGGRLVLVGVLWVGLALTTIATETAPPFGVSPQLFRPGEPALGLKTLPGKHELLYRATEDGHKFCHHANLVVFRDELYCMWSNGFVDEDEPGQWVLYCHSSDGGNWTEATLLTEHTRDGGYAIATGFLVASEKLVAFYTGTGSNNFHPDTSLWARKSVDGLVWSEPQRITSGLFIEAPFRLPGGRWLLAGEQVGQRRESGRMRLLTTDQQDGLGGWEEAPVTIEKLATFGYTEPSAFMRRDGSTALSIRNYSGHLYASMSSDNGRSWTTPAPTNFPDSLARCSAGNLPDGTAYLINNPMSKQLDRSLLTIALSRDGVTFDRAWVIRSEPTSLRFSGNHKIDGWQYPHAIVWKDDLYVAYSINKEDLGITRIALRELLDDADPGGSE